MVLPKSQRLRRSRDFSKVYRLGSKAVSAHLVVKVLETTGIADQTIAPADALLPSPSAGLGRVGIVVSQKVSKRAVVRNRLKRQVRAIMAQILPQLRPHLWVVINLRPGAEQCEYGDFLQELKQLFTQLEVFHGHS
ncbi:ribonuclease P protein component [Phormidium sp. FACHB-1136]|nr:ribonuclease P protein component [Phormidium sp. FACHB-1136]